MSETDQRHKYEYAVDPTTDTAPARVVRMVGKAKKVLEIGSGPGSITRLLSELNACKVTALEIDPDAIEKVKSFCEAVHPADLNDVAWPKILGSEKFEVVVAADVLEHLYVPLQALTAMRHLIQPDGYIVISLPHVGHAAIVACLLQEDFEYRDWGLLDRTHIRFFGIKNIQSLFADAGLKIVAAEFVVRHPEATEFVARWQALSDAAKAVALANPFGLVYQTVIKAVPLEAPGEPVLLMNLPVEQLVPVATAPEVTPSGWRHAVKQQARQHLSHESRVKLRNLAIRLGIKV
jgi:2-polyprenyl-3-methyl-5-hydroxy-6-metoxy-1,4-benzoquinol methylase